MTNQQIKDLIMSTKDAVMHEYNKLTYSSASAAVLFSSLRRMNDVRNDFCEAERLSQFEQRGLDREKLFSKGRDMFALPTRDEIVF